MGQRMNPRLRKAIDELILGRNYSVDDIIAHLSVMEERGGASPCDTDSNEKNVEEVMASFRRTQEISKSWMAEFGSAPESGVGKMAIEMLKVSIHRLSMKNSERDIKELEALSRAMKNITAADNQNIANVARIREAVRAEEAERVKKEMEKMRQGGFDQDTLDAVENRISIYLPANAR